MAYDKHQHFILEKKLANELRDSNLQQRRSLYMRVYNDLFSTFPEITHNIDASVEQRLGWQLKFLKRLFNKDKVFMEIGSGDCLLAKELTRHFKKVVAFEVADVIPFVEGTPDNFELKIFNGFDMKEEPLSYDVIYSNQVFEHLHPDDTIPLLRSYHKFLTDEGKLVIVTPNRLTGPHDVSRGFCEDAEGFHLKEYTYKELKALLKATGYKKLRGYVGHKKLGYFALNISLLVIAEKMYNVFPKFIRKKVKHSSVLFNLFGLKITAVKK